MNSLFGFLLKVILINVHKTCGLWFSRRRLGLANGVASTGMVLGFMVGSMISATLLSPWLSGWRNVLFLYGAVSIVVGVIWSLMREVPEDVGSSTSSDNNISLYQTLLHIVHLRNVWFLGFAIFCVGGCIQGMLGYLPLYLREIGWMGADADKALATFHGISLICAIPIALFSDRLGSRKVILVAATVMITVGVILLVFP